jgi:hypothetical protein
MEHRTLSYPNSTLTLTLTLALALSPSSHHSITSGGSGDNMYFSWSIGNVHFLSMNSETELDVGNFAEKEIEWLKADLAAVDRMVTPWLIANFHRPMYCK